MSIIPFKRNELARWRMAINDASLRLEVAVRGNEAALVASEGRSGGDGADSLVARALVHLHNDLDHLAADPFVGFRTELLIAIGYRERLTALMQESGNVSRLRYATITAAEAHRAYLEALTAILRWILERDGVGAVRNFASARAR